MKAKCLLTLLLLLTYPNYNLNTNYKFETEQHNESIHLKVNIIKRVSTTPSTTDNSELNTIVTSINNYQNLYPDYTEQQIIEKVYEETYSNGYLGTELNKTEFQLVFDRLGLLGFLKIKNIRDEVVDKTKKYYGDSNGNDDSDAFRHMYLAGTLYKEIDKQFAIDLLNAHEEGQTGLSSKMDLHNNSRGLYLYEVWNNKYSETYSLTDFLFNCVANGYIYNVVKLDNKNESMATKFIYTSVGNDIPEIFENECMTIISKKYSSMTSMNYHWYKFSSENKKGEYKIFSSSNTNLKAEIYSSLDDEYVLKSSNTTGDFSLKIDLTYYESVYIKVYGINDADVGDYFLNIEEVKTTEAPTYTYQKYDKKKHKRISSDGTSTLELHAVSANANGNTNCLLCGQHLNTYTDGPFITAYSINYISTIRTIKDEYTLSEEDWEKYVFGTYFRGEHYEY